MAVANGVGHGWQLGQWAEIEVDEIPATGVHSVGWRGPAVSFEQPTRHRIDALHEGREQAHVTPLINGGPSRLAALEYEKREVAFDQVGSGGEADWSGSDHNDGMFLWQLALLLSPWKTECGADGCTFTVMSLSREVY